MHEATGRRHTVSQQCRALASLRQARIIGVSRTTKRARAMKTHDTATHQRCASPDISANGSAGISKDQTHKRTIRIRRSQCGIGFTPRFSDTEKRTIKICVADDACTLALSWKTISLKARSCWRSITTYHSSNHNSWKVKIDQLPK